MSRRLPVLHGYALGVFHLLFGFALDTICLHHINLLFCMQDRTFTMVMSIASLQLPIALLGYLLRHASLDLHEKHGK